MISIVIPAYNEKTNIAITITNVTSFMKDFHPDFEILIVDDGSTDSTSSVVKALLPDNPKVRLMENPHKGKGFAVRTGVEASEGDYILLFDADSATPIEELKRALLWIDEKGYDVVIGSREGFGAVRKNEPWIRHIMGRAFNTLVKIVTGLEFMDTQCGFKLFKGRVGREVFAKSRLYGDLTKEVRVPKVTAFDVEILFIAKKLGYKIKEIPVVWEYGRNTKVNNIRDSITNLMDVLKVFSNERKGLY